MEFRFGLNLAIARWLLLLFALILCLVLSQIVTTNFIIGVFNDRRTTVTKAELESAAAYYPSSSSLQALLAEAEMTEAADHEGTAVRAEAAANRAVNLSPWKYNLRLLLASARELNGNRAGTESSLREALRLAPTNVEVHWRLANLLVRENRVDESFPHFRAAVTANLSLLPSVHNLVWGLSGGKPEAVEAVTGYRPEARLALAFFLLRQSRIKDAAQVFAQVDPKVRLRWGDTQTFINALIPIGEAELSRRLWAELVTGRQEANWPLIWNGGFEDSNTSNLVQFDWVIGSSKFAALSIDPGVGRTGSRSLRVDFAGLDTTTLDAELKQLFLVRPGARYRLECFIKTRNLITPEGPRMIINHKASQIAATPAVSSGTNDWQPLAVEFVAPAEVLEIKLQRKPKFDYDEPTRGTIWIDDVNLTELGQTSVRITK